MTTQNESPPCVGNLAYDKDTEDVDPVLVLDIPGGSCNDKEAAKLTYDWKMNVVTVADKNPEYDPDQPFAVVAFVSALERENIDWESLPIEEVYSRVEDSGVRTYSYPVARLSP